MLEILRKWKKKNLNREKITDEISSVTLRATMLDFCKHLHGGKPPVTWLLENLFLSNCQVSQRKTEPLLNTFNRILKRWLKKSAETAVILPDHYNRKRQKSLISPGLQYMYFLYCETMDRRTKRQGEGRKKRTTFHELVVHCRDAVLQKCLSPSLQVIR